MMFSSANKAYPGKVMALVLTGMGSDGLLGTREIVQNGGHAFVQNEATSLVYSMPKAISEAGLADAVLPLEELAPAIMNAIGYRQDQSIPSAA